MQLLKTRWTPGNRFTLLENGEDFFPRVFECITNAEREVVLETFILFDDKVGQGLRTALIAAASRGVRVDVMVDGFGSPDLSDAYVRGLTEAGVRLRIYEPGKRVFGWRYNLLRRMHRKIVVIDGARAFVGGINYSADHLSDFGPEAKQDYAVEIEGPIVGTIHRFVLHAIASGGGGRHWFRRRRAALPLTDPQPAGDADAIFVTRDNRRNRTAIERHYRAAIRSARQRVIIANAYFFPGFRFIQEMRRAARRGVDVRLILQGQPDMPIVKVAASMLYHHLLHAGVKIFEYCDRPLHGKVAVVDDAWSTVGSSNLDPLSLALNLESNVIIRDRAFTATLADRLDALMANSCKTIEAKDLNEWSVWRLVRSFFVFHLIRGYPSWAGWLPRHAPRLHKVPHADGSTTTESA